MIRLQKFEKYKVVPFIMAMIIMLAGCGDKIDYTLPDNPIEFSMGTFTDPGNAEDSYGSIEYNGRTYIGYGTQKGNVSGKDLGECLGYIVQDGEKIEDSRVFLLSGDPDANYLGEFSAVTLMNPPIFYRAIDTLGQEITTPDFIDDLGYDFWKIR